MPALCKAVKEMQQGIYDADLGGGLFKKRIARQGHGKRGGFRTLLVTNKGDRWFFVFGFAKNEQDNIAPDQELSLKELAKELLALSLIDLEKLKSANKLTEVRCDENKKIGNFGSST
jgi:hypothetical protein